MQAAAAIRLQGQRPAWRNAMSHWIDKLQLTSDDPTFTLAEVSALVALLGERGVETAALLKAADIDRSMLSDSECRISLRQQCKVQHAALAGGHSGALLTALAQRLHLTSYGIAGYALLSSPNLAEAARVAELLSPLLNLKFSLSLQVDWPTVHLRLDDRYALSQESHDACLFLELAKVATLLRDVLGEDFRPHAVRCAAAGMDGEYKALSAVLGCEVNRSSEATEITFDAALLSRPLPLSHPTTHASCLRVCDALMAGLASRFDLVRHIKDLMLKATGRPPALSELAAELCVSQRTLRRRLDALDTSYNKILEDVRKELAVRYLTTTQYTTEDIAQLIGYSEAANFRHAFKRWTGAAPSAFRASHVIAAVTKSSAPPRVPAYARKPSSSHRNLLDQAAACWG
jgi:AraC-like DNA-binding protein